MPAPLGSDRRTQPPGPSPCTPACANPHLFKRSLEATGAQHFQPAPPALQCPGLNPVLCCAPSLRAVGGAHESRHVTVSPSCHSCPPSKEARPCCWILGHPIPGSYSLKKIFCTWAGGASWPQKNKAPTEALANPRKEAEPWLRGWVPHCIQPSSLPGLGVVL